MKLPIAVIAAIFSLLMLTVPGQASADAGSSQPTSIEQIGYYQLYLQNAGYWHSRPYACRYRRYRHRHPYLCR